MHPGLSGSFLFDLCHPGIAINSISFPSPKCPLWTVDDMTTLVVTLSPQPQPQSGEQCFHVGLVITRPCPPNPGKDTRAVTGFLPETAAAWVLVGCWFTGLGVREGWGSSPQVILLCGAKRSWE